MEYSVLNMIPIKLRDQSGNHVKKGSKNLYIDDL